MKPSGPGPVKPPPGVKTRIDRARRAVLVSVPVGQTDLYSLREFLYRVLNAYENSFTVAIKGVPFCFLPDAYDHILPPPARPGLRRLAICRECHLNHICAGLPKISPFAALPAGELRPVLKVPSEIVFEVSRRCNLACGVCSSRQLDAQISLSRVNNELEQARRLGIKNIRFTGGEPFLHPEILSMLRTAKTMGFYILFNTNATLPGSALIRKTAPLIDNLLVSMQGCDPASDAAETGRPGLFEKKLANIRLFRRSGVPVVRLGTVISSGLAGNFEKYLTLITELDADIWELYRPMPAAVGMSARGKEITPELLRRLAARIEKLPRAKPQILFANPVPLCLFSAKQAPLFLGARFDDGHTRLVLDPRGFYKASYYMQKDLGGNIMAAWNSPFLKKLDKAWYLESGCRRCEVRLRCLGGSRFMAGADSDGQDPWLRNASRRLALFDNAEEKKEN